MQALGENRFRTTLAFRVAADRKFRVLAAAARSRELPSDWLRRVTDEALKREGLLPQVDRTDEPDGRARPRSHV